MFKVSLQNLADAAMLSAVVWAQWRIGTAILAWRKDRPGWAPRLIPTLMWAVGGCLVLGFVFSFHTAERLVPLSSGVRGTLSGGAYVWAFIMTGGYFLYLPWRWFANRAGAREMDPGRRKLINGAGGALVAAPLAICGFGAFVQRTDFRVRESDIRIPDLPRDLEGLRVLQLSDIHLGPFLDERDLARVIDEARNLRSHLAVITGDLISMRGDPLDACLRQIARLRADAGILGCMGNHEVYSGVEEYTAEQGARLGIHFLREQARALRFGSSTLNVAGVDYQPMRTRRTYLAGAERLIAAGAVNVLLSHNPDVFPVAAGQGFDLTISGHTHGGQVNVEILHQDLNIARFFTPFVSGRYELQRPAGGKASAYVSRGIGTIGLPVRLGAPPEITLLRLVAG